MYSGMWGVEMGANSKVGLELRFFRISRHHDRWGVSRSAQVVFLERECGGGILKGNKVGRRDEAEDKRGLH
jgi:hypothetical protein